MEDFPNNLEDLAELLKHKKLSYSLILDAEKLASAMKTIDYVESIVKEEDPDASIEVHFDPLLGTSLGVEIITTNVAIRNAPEFCMMAKNVDVIGIEPRVDDKVIFSLLFNDVKKPID